MKTAQFTIYYRDAAALNNQSSTIIETQQQLMAPLQDVFVMLKANQEVPPQVLLSEPVVLLDACGRYAPFHIEFIDSFEVYITIFKFRFSAAAIAYIGFHRCFEGPIQRRRSTQNRRKKICA